jgi:hypothetical protein
VGLNPDEYGVSLVPLPAIEFAKNDIGFIDPSGVDHDLLGLGLKKAIYNYMHGLGFEEDVRVWFKGFVKNLPKSTVPRQKLAKILSVTG